MLKYPSFIVAILFILFVNIVFYVSLFVLLNKKRAVGIAIVLVAVIGLTVVHNDNRRAESLYNETETLYTETVNNRVNEADSIPSKEKEEVKEEVNAPLEDPEWYDLISVDFEGLKEQNKEIIGWIFFEDVDINYPILQGNTNGKYLRTSYLGDYSRSGSIFLDFLNSPDFSDFHSIVYGHNMGNDTMFGNLLKYRDEENYYSEHPYFQIITPEKKYRYEIVACKQVHEDDPLYDLSKVSEYDCETYVNDFLLKDSVFDLSLTAYERDRFVTLSTCSRGSKRFVVTAFRIAEY